MIEAYALSPRARLDLYEIAQYGLAHWSERRTDNYLAAIASKLSSLSTFPHSGRAEPLAGENIRTTFVERHVVIYRMDESLKILRIVHQSSDWNALAVDESAMEI